MSSALGMHQRKGVPPSQTEALFILVQWNPALRTPAYYGQLCLPRQEAHIFSLPLAWLILSMDTFSVTQVTRSHT